MDEQIPWMNYKIWAEDINDPHTRVLKARYYGEISYIDNCIGQILDTLEKRDDAENTLICFFADHGDHLGDHHAWQKESFFEQSCHVPFLVSWPEGIKEQGIREELVCLTDLFGIATHAAGETDVREGSDVLGMLKGAAEPRNHIIGMYGMPGTDRFKIMVLSQEWKYIYIANGGFEQLFNVKENPEETENRLNSASDVAAELKGIAIESSDCPGAQEALEGDGFKSFAFNRKERSRIHQFDRSRGIYGFPEKPEDVFTQYPAKPVK
jgi:choline-sulfatase